MTKKEGSKDENSMEVLGSIFAEYLPLASRNPDVFSIFHFIIEVVDVVVFLSLMAHKIPHASKNKAREKLVVFCHFFPT